MSVVSGRRVDPALDEDRLHRVAVAHLTEPGDPRVSGLVDDLGAAVVHDGLLRGLDLEGLGGPEEQAQQGQCRREPHHSDVAGRVVCHSGPAGLNLSTAACQQRIGRGRRVAWEEAEPEDRG